MDQVRLHRLRLRDRTELKTLLTALNGAKNALCLDECGDYTITGSRGTIRACDGKFSIYLSPGSPTAWTWAKKKLAAIAVPTQEGNDEGILMFERMPTEIETEVIRDYVGLRQTHGRPVRSRR